MGTESQIRKGEQMDDLISRQAAIDAVIKRDANCGIDSAEVLRSLPSAQPEIIRCKDCKHYKAYEYTGILACHYVIGCTVEKKPDDFCSRAERITDE